MTLETIKVNIDKKIEKMIDTENKTLPEVARQLYNTKENFKRILEADADSSPKNHMMTMYIDHAEKRVKDFRFIQETLVTKEYFAGSSDLKLFKLLKFRDNVSKDVLQVAVAA